MKKITITLLLAAIGFLAPSIIKAQLVNIGSPIQAMQTSNGTKGVTANGKTVWCVYHTYDQIAKVNYMKIAKYNGLFWADYYSLPAIEGGSFGDGIFLQYFNNNLYFTGFYKEITLSSGTYKNIAGLFKWDGVQVSLIDLFSETLNGNKYLRFHDMDTFKSELYISGTFDSIAGVSYPKVAKYDGTNWSLLGTATQRADVKLLGFQLVHNDNRLLLAGDSIAGNTTPYYGIASYDGTNLSPIDSSEIYAQPHPNFRLSFNRLMSHPDSSSYYFNESLPYNYAYCRGGKIATLLEDDPTAYHTATNHPYERFAYNNGAVYTLQPGANTGPQNQFAPIIQKFKGESIKRIYPPNNLWVRYFNPLGTFGNNSVYFEFEDARRGFKSEFYRLDSNEMLSSTISGRAYVDMNRNCKYDAGDRPIANQWIKLSNNTSPHHINALTDEFGSYLIGGIPLGKDTILSKTAVNKKLICSSLASQPINLIKDTNLVRDFIYSYDSTKKDLEVRTFSRFGFRARRGFNDEFHVTVKNNSAFVRSGFVLIDMDSAFTYKLSSDTNISFIGKKVKFKFNNLGPDELITGTFKMTIPVFVRLNSLVHINAELDSMNAKWDNCPQNNTDRKLLRVRAAFDPNDKTSYPSGDILPGTEDITYHINFQNVGNDTAYRVIIVDTIDNRLPLEKIVIGSSSHPFTLKVVNNTLVFQFENIRLVDSATNEPLSKGYVRFHAKLNPNFPLGTKVDNRAHIYFDFNKAIETNIASILIAKPDHVVPVEQKQLKLYPNPAENVITIDNTNQGKHYSLFNMMGQNVQAGSLIDGKNKINISLLPNGIYIVKIDGQNTLNKLQILH